MVLVEVVNNSKGKVRFVSRCSRTPFLHALLGNGRMIEWGDMSGYIKGGAIFLLFTAACQTARNGWVASSFSEEVWLRTS
jgi:hypothetical protein